MNVFYVDKNPLLAAQALVDQHVNKMVTETAQILSNCFTLEQLAQPDCPRTGKGTSRRHSYPHHPCCKWVLESAENFQWLICHGFGLEMERLYRGFNPSLSVQFIQWCRRNRQLIKFDKLEMNDPPQAFGTWDNLRGNDTIEAYRRYYNIAKRQQKTLKKVWTRRGPPDWWIKDE